MDVFIEKTGSIYNLVKISNDKTNVFSKDGKFIVKHLSVRLIGIHEDSELYVSINNNESSYVISDINAMFQGDSKVPYMPYMTYYYVGSDISENEFVVSLYTDEFIQSLKISVYAPNRSKAEFAVEYVLQSTKEELKEKIPDVVKTIENKRKITMYGRRRVI